ncbi:protein of unknown function [Stenotrophomonas maltophilia]|nr:protein of unknown function [Stenotrophomonas maltophilia]
MLSHYLPGNNSRQHQRHDGNMRNPFLHPNVPDWALTGPATPCSQSYLAQRHILLW